MLAVAAAVLAGKKAKVWRSRWGSSSLPGMTVSGDTKEMVERELNEYMDKIGVLKSPRAFQRREEPWYEDRTFYLIDAEGVQIGGEA